MVSQLTETVTLPTLSRASPPPLTPSQTDMDIDSIPVIIVSRSSDVPNPNNENCFLETTPKIPAINKGDTPHVENRASTKSPPKKKKTLHHTEKNANNKSSTNAGGYS